METPETIPYIPETVTVSVAEVQQHNQLLHALSTALGHLLEPSQGVVIDLNGQLHVVFNMDNTSVSLAAVSSDDAISPGSIITVTHHQEETGAEVVNEEAVAE